MPFARLGQRRLLVLLQRAYPIALLFESCAQFKNHLRLFGIEGDRLLKLSDRHVVLVGSSQRLPEKIMDMPIARRQSLGLFQLGDGSSNIFLGQQNSPYIQVSVGHFRTQPLRQSEFLEGRVVVFLLFLNTAQTRVSFEIGRIKLRSLTEFRVSARRVPGPEQPFSQAYVAHFEIWEELLQLSQLHDGSSRITRHERRREVLTDHRIIGV